MLVVDAARVQQVEELQADERVEDCRLRGNAVARECGCAVRLRG